MCAASPEGMADTGPSQHRAAPPARTQCAAIVTDAAADISKEVLRQIHVHAAPLHVYSGMRVAFVPAPRHFATLSVISKVPDIFSTVTSTAQPASSVRTVDCRATNSGGTSYARGS